MAHADGIHSEIDVRTLAIDSKLIAWRRNIHEHPELGNREFRTAKLVADHLRSIGLEVKTGVAGTGVIAILKGALPGPTVALRADMDALPIAERPGLAFASHAKSRYLDRDTPVMHACGHDAHTAILMAAAEVLAGMRNRLPGSVKFIFQPAEEGPSDFLPDGKRSWGAERMVHENVLKAPEVDAIFGLHVVSDLSSGVLAWRAGPATASNDSFEIDVIGKGTHGAQPWRGIDPVVVASQIVLGIQTIQSRQMDVSLEPSVITIGTIHGGDKINIVPERVSLSGTIRTYDEAMREDIHRRIERTASLIATSAGATATVRIVKLQGPSINDPNLVSKMGPTLERVGGTKGHLVARKVTGSEDFSFFQREVPGLLFLLGVTPEAQLGKAAPNHSPDFLIDEGALRQGVRAMANLAFDFLRRRDGTAEGIVP